MVNKSYEGYLREQLRRLVAREPIEYPIKTHEEFCGRSGPNPVAPFTTDVRTVKDRIKSERYGRLSLDLAD